MRETTERPEDVKAEVVLLPGINKDTVVNYSNTLLENQSKYNEIAKAKASMEAAALLTILNQVLDTTEKKACWLVHTNLISLLT